MWYTLPPNTPLYRVSRQEDEWDAVLQGFGAFYAAGNRYNIVGQQTIYASRDPLVALTEFAFHVAVSLCQEWADGTNPISYPLVAAANLWEFTLNTSVTLIRVSNPQAQHQFNYPAHAPFNPCFHLYTRTQQIANAVRHWAHPPAPHTRPEGLIAPSVRVARVGRYQPEQVILFVFPAGPGGVVNETLQDRGHLSGRWDVELQIQTTSPPRAVSPHTLRIGWLTPRCRLTGNPHPVPPHPNRPHRQPILVNQWHQLDVQFAST